MGEVGRHEPRERRRVAPRSARLAAKGQLLRLALLPPPLTHRSVALGYAPAHARSPAHPRHSFKLALARPPAPPPRTRRRSLLAGQAVPPAPTARPALDRRPSHPRAMHLSTALASLASLALSLAPAVLANPYIYKPVEASHYRAGDSFTVSWRDVRPLPAPSSLAARAPS